MAQRNDGAANLEAFIAATAETRASLQRDAEKVAELTGRVEDLDERLDDEMKDLGQTVREFDEEYGPAFEEWSSLYLATVFLGIPWVGPAFYQVMRPLGKQTAHLSRLALVAGAELLEKEYEAFPQRREEAQEALDEAAEAAAESFESFSESAADALQEAVAAKSKVTELTRAMVRQCIDNFPKR